MERGTGFARVLAPRPFEFPRDHGPHPGYRTEWWYVTGNVHDADGRPFGFQVTFFRIALVAAPPARASAWGASDVYMAHLAVSDLATGRFLASERFSRAAQGLAGAGGEPVRVWLEDWLLEADMPVMRLRAGMGATGLDLRLRSLKPPVLQGDRGLSQKGPEVGNASYYYSLTRMRTAGTITVDGRTFTVEGSSWMDREWGTSALAPDQVGWDWFALQLDDGRDVMLYRLRRRDGSLDPFSSGTLVAHDGTTRRLHAADATVDVLATWRSPRDGHLYPARWRLTVPSDGLDLTVTPRMADQELVLGVRYWEGAVGVRGTAAGRPLAGVGYVELTGYGE
jgi:predicted secreted hydrolase